MKLPKLVDCIAKGVEAKFVRYSDRALWYRIEFQARDVIDWGGGQQSTVLRADEFEFPVPIEDTHGGTFNATEPSSIFQRWIRKHIEFLFNEKAKAKAEALRAAYTPAVDHQDAQRPTDLLLVGVAPAVEPEPDTDPASEEG